MSNEKESIWKKIGIAIAGIFTGIIALLFGRSIRDNRNRADEVRDNIGEAKESNQSARDTVSDIRSTTDSIKQTNDECSEIIRDIRQRNKKR